MVVLPCHWIICKHFSLVPDTLLDLFPSYFPVLSSIYLYQMAPANFLPPKTTQGAHLFLLIVQLPLLQSYFHPLIPLLKYSPCFAAFLLVPLVHTKITAHTWASS